MGQKSNPIILRLGKSKQDWHSKYFEKKSNKIVKYIYNDLEIQSYIEQFLKNYGLILHGCKINYSNSSLYIHISYYLATKLLSLKLNNSLKSDFQNLTVIRSLDFQNYSEYSTFNSKKILQNQTFDQIVIAYILNSKNKMDNQKKTELNYKIESHNLLKSETFVKRLLKSLTMFTENKLKINLIFQQLNRTIRYNKNILELNKRKVLDLRRFRKENFFKDAINIIMISTTQKNSSKLLAEFIAIQLRKQNKRHNLFLRFLKNLLIRFINHKFSRLKGIQIKISGRFNRVPRAKNLTIKVGQVPIMSLNSQISYHESISYSQNGTFGVKVWLIEK